MSRWVVIITIVLIGLVCSGNTLALSGSGTQEDPWRIESLADFDEFASDPNYWSGFTRLETDVNLAARLYEKSLIAMDASSSDDFQGTPFTGVFDGNSHRIIGLTIDDGGAGNDCLGLFGCIRDGEVKNLGLEGGSIRGDENVGDLVGSNGNWPNSGGTISNCYSTGDVGTEMAVGSLVGWNSHGIISNCYSTGSGSGEYLVGGLVGSNSGSVSNCYSTGSASGEYFVGGLVGDNSDGSIRNCYATGSVSGTFCGVGGLVGNNRGSISNCHSKGNVNGTATILGGLCGDNAGTISNCYATGSASGQYYVGGLVARNYGIIANCYSTGNIRGDEDIGGLAGENCLIISNSYSVGHVNGRGEVGGLVGGNWDGGSVSNCYSTGDVNGIEYVGGLVGKNGSVYYDTEYPGNIFNSYSYGSVQGTSNVGGLVGAHESGEIEGSFWDVQTSGEPNMCGSQNEGYATGCDPNCGKTTAEMKTRSTFAEAGWDFVDIWLINEGATYPVLRQEIRSDLNGADGVDLLDFAIFADHWLERKGE